VLELACGKGEYAIGLSLLHPEKNFIGIDVKGNRIWVGAKKAIENKMDNVAFIRSQIGMIHNYFAPGEVDEIWLPFPDPQLRISKTKNRLTHPIFLRKFQQILKPGGYINLKTDSPTLYAFTKLVIGLHELTLEEDVDDVGKNLPDNKELQIKTHYEGLDIAGSKRVHYLKFKVDKPLALNKDEALMQAVKLMEKDNKEGKDLDEKETD
jgi:tRNA (guanine-N7-)-methyltransferase